MMAVVMSGANHGTKQVEKIGSRHPFVACDIVYGQFGVLAEMPLDIVSARNDPSQARIGRPRVVRTIDDEHPHFTTDPLKGGRVWSISRVIGGMGQFLIWHR
jgi:hypothetical protein